MCDVCVCSCVKCVCSCVRVVCVTVAMQCICEAYGINMGSEVDRGTYEVGSTLEVSVQLNHVKKNQITRLFFLFVAPLSKELFSSVSVEPSEDDKKRAEQHKQEGSKMLK